MFIVTVSFGPYTAAFTDRIPIGVNTHAYPGIISLDEFRFAQAERYGGYVSAQYGSLVLSPDAFTATNPALSAWPPVETLDQVTVQVVPDDGSTPFYLPSNFTGLLESASAEQLVYTLSQYRTYDDTELDKRYTGTLVSCFTAACSTLGLTLNYSWAEYPSPDVDWDATGDNLLLDNLSNLAKFFNHRFFIDGSTLYLIGCQISAIADIDLTSSDITRVEYLWGAPLVDFTTDHKVDSVSNISVIVLETLSMSAWTQIAELQIAKSSGGALVIPSAVYATASDPSYPVSNLRDGNTATKWSSGSRMPGVLVETLTTIGKIVEYAFTATTSPGDTPTKWRLLAKSPATGDNHQVSVVVSDGWTSGEVRRFTVPEEITFPATYTHPDGGEGELRITPTCHTVYANLITALQNIATEMRADNARITMPIRDINPGQRLKLTDTTTVGGETISFEMLARDITYNFQDGLVVIEGARGPV